MDWSDLHYERLNSMKYQKCSLAENPKAAEAFGKLYKQVCFLKD